MNTKSIRIITMFLALLATLSINASAEQDGDRDQPHGNAPITAQELKRLINAKDPKLVILAADNSIEYRLGHISGSHHVDRPAIEAHPEAHKRRQRHPH